MRQLVPAFAALAFLSACGESEQDRLYREVTSIAKEMDIAAQRLPTVSQVEHPSLVHWMQTACNYLQEREDKLRVIAQKKGDSFVRSPAGRHCP